MLLKKCRRSCHLSVTPYVPIPHPRSFFLYSFRILYFFPQFTLISFLVCLLCRYSFSPSFLPLLYVTGCSLYDSYQMMHRHRRLTPCQTLLQLRLLRAQININWHLWNHVLAWCNLKNRHGFCSNWSSHNINDSTALFHFRILHLNFCTLIIIFYLEVWYSSYLNCENIFNEIQFLS
jgi:hypothetical protein